MPAGTTLIVNTGGTSSCDFNKIKIASKTLVTTARHKKQPFQVSTKSKRFKTRKGGQQYSPPQIIIFNHCRQ